MRQAYEMLLQSDSLNIPSLIKINNQPLKSIAGITCREGWLKNCEKLISCCACFNHQWQEYIMGEYKDIILIAQRWNA